MASYGRTSTFPRAERSLGQAREATTQLGHQGRPGRWAVKQKQEVEGKLRGEGGDVQSDPTTRVCNGAGTGGSGGRVQGHVYQSGFRWHGKVQKTVLGQCNPQCPPHPHQSMSVSYLVLWGMMDRESNMVGLMMVGPGQLRALVGR
jgi:hypothetical protein